MTQEPQDAEQLRFTTIHYGVLRQLKLNANEYLILDMVYHLSIKHGYCYKSIPSIASDLGLTRMGAYKIINRLLDRGLLNRSAAGLVCGSDFIDTAYLQRTPVNKVYRKQSLRKKKVNKVDSKVNKVYGGKQSTSKIYSIEEQKNNMDAKASLSTDKPLTAGKVTYKTLFYELIDGLGFSKTTILTKERLLKLKQRMKTYSPDDLRKAAKSLGGDGRMQGDNDTGKRWGNIDYLLRNDTNVAKYLESADIFTPAGEIDEAKYV